MRYVFISKQGRIHGRRCVLPPSSPSLGPHHWQLVHLNSVLRSQCIMRTAQSEASAKWLEWLWNWRVEYWAIRSSARTAHSFACSALLASLMRFAALISILARSLARKLMGKRFLSMKWTRQFHNISTQCGAFSCISKQGRIHGRRCVRLCYLVNSGRAFVCVCVWLCLVVAAPLTR